MREMLTTDEAAEYLRLSERKLYELVANSAVPCTKVTGRWLFPKAALDRWVLSGLVGGPARTNPPPLIVGGSHDPLLEWALRESGSGLASLPEGSEEGLRRLTRAEVLAAAIHLHRLEGDDDEANPDTVATTPGLHDAVVIAFARREQGLLVKPGNPLKLTDIASVAAKRARVNRGADLDEAGLPDRRRRGAGGAHGPRRLRGRDARGGAGGRHRFHPDHLGALRPRAAAALLFHAGPAGAVRLSARGLVSRPRRGTRRL